MKVQINKLYSKPRILLIGRDHVGKSTFAATLPKPQLVIFTDYNGKDHAYLKGAVEGSEKEAPDGHRILKLAEREIHYFHDLNVDVPIASAQLLTWLPTVDFSQFASVVLDSISSLDLTAREFSRLKLNAHNPKRIIDYSHSKSVIESTLLRLGSVRAVVCVIGHIDMRTAKMEEDNEGETVYTVSVPGELRTTIGSKFPEMWRAYIEKDKSGNRRYLLQTQGDGRHSCGTCLGLPDPCKPSWAYIEKFLSNKES